MRMIHLAAWGTLAIAVVLWGAFGYLVSSVYAERAELEGAKTAAQEEALRGESLARLHATVKDTQVERAALEGLLEVSILDAVEVIEQAGRQAGASSVAIGNATPLTGANVPKGVTAYAIVVNAEGSFSAIVRALSLYETLALPVALEQFEMENDEGVWRSTVHLKLLLTSETP